MDSSGTEARPVSTAVVARRRILGHLGLSLSAEQRHEERDFWSRPSEPATADVDTHKGGQKSSGKAGDRRPGKPESRIGKASDADSPSSTRPEGASPDVVDTDQGEAAKNTKVKGTGKKGKKGKGKKKGGKKGPVSSSNDGGKKGSASSSNELDAIASSLENLSLS